MKRKLKKKELEKVSGGWRWNSPQGQDTNQNGEEEKGIMITVFAESNNLDTNQQSGGNSTEGKVTPK